MDTETKRGLKILAVLVCAVLATACLSGCAAAPQAALDAEKLGTEHAVGFCRARHTGAMRAAASCEALCPGEERTDYCARKRCAIELGSIAEWDDVADWCAKYTPPIYYKRPEWPGKGLQPIAEEDT